jgi:hypothetical protein
VTTHPHCSHGGRRLDAHVRRWTRPSPRLSRSWGYDRVSLWVAPCTPPPARPGGSNREKPLTKKGVPQMSRGLRPAYGGVRAGDEGPVAREHVPERRSLQQRLLGRRGRRHGLFRPQPLPAHLGRSLHARRLTLLAVRRQPGPALGAGQEPPTPFLGPVGRQPLPDQDRGRRRLQRPLTTGLADKARSRSGAGRATRRRRALAR